MKTHYKLFALLMVALMVLTACGGDENSAADEIAKMDTDTPDGAFLANVAAMKANDLHSLMKNSLSEQKYNDLVTEFENNKTGNFSEADKAQFAQTMSMLTADGAEDMLFEMAKPQLEQARAMLPMMVMMGKDQMIQGIKTNPMIPEDQRETLAAVAGAAVDWIGENDILSEEKTKAAIASVVGTAKAMNMTSLDEVENMTFEQALAKGSIALGGLKDLLDVYGLSMNDMLDSVDVGNVNVNGDQATMDVNFEIFGETIKQTMNMVKKDGVWVGEQ